VVTVSDLKGADALAANIETLKGLPILFVLGGHPPAILDADVIFVSPGVPQEAPILQQARQRGVPLSSETRLFFERCTAPIIGITGSSGKTTTTALVDEMLKTDGQTTFVGGNIGQPLIEQVDSIPPTAWVVLELSSFQLELMNQSPQIAAILNITPNHLDRHPTMEHYIAAKKNIVLHQSRSDTAVLGFDDTMTRQLARDCPGRVLFFSQKDEVEQGTFRRGDWLMLRLGGTEQEICPLSMIRLRGRHNIDNVLAACVIAGAAGAAGAKPEAMSKAIAGFTGVEHRLEWVRERHGVKYFNDSIATSPERAIAALRSFTEPIVLLAGGREKHLPMGEFARLVNERVTHLVLFGEAAELIENAVRTAGACPERGEGSKPVIHRAATFEEAVTTAAQVAQPGDVVLLAPACASFDMFIDFAHRGRRFKELVNQLP
jgi:UDP-N-acetylmuramoylalanine--D-glutamate ligase